MVKYISQNTLKHVWWQSIHDIVSLKLEPSDIGDTQGIVTWIFKMIWWYGSEKQPGQMCNIVKYAVLINFWNSIILLIVCSAIKYLKLATMVYTSLRRAHVVKLSFTWIWSGWVYFNDFSFICAFNSNCSPKSLFHTRKDRILWMCA